MSHVSCAPTTPVRCRTSLEVEVECRHCLQSTQGRQPRIGSQCHHFLFHQRVQFELVKKTTLEPQEVSYEDVRRKLSLVAGFCFKDSGRNWLVCYLANVFFVLDMVFKLEGGAGFIIAPIESYDHLRQEMKVEFDVVDKSAMFLDGYMTQQLHDKHVATVEHRKHVQDFAQHTAGDRWPKQHEAAHLPKDGYNLYGASGFCHLAAARLLGLPVAPYEWEGVGMQHTAALQLCWALRGHTAVVVARSDYGAVHILCPGKESVEVLVVTR